MNWSGFGHKIKAVASDDIAAEAQIPLTANAKICRAHGAHLRISGIYKYSVPNRPLNILYRCAANKTAAKAFSYRKYIS
ncbi:hypothetical protein [Niabella sp.]|uniref:hypothetical protein n=1 Tax=Niabella sp. TaxID=1962976 RepID=UPI00260B3006|nr:hypothetical protein [Niabella sp.]